jgi:hypothetical protein
MANRVEIEEFLNSIYRSQDVDGAVIPIVKRLSNTLLRPLMTLAAIQYLMSFPIVKVAIRGTERSKTRWLFDPRRPWRHRGFISSYIELPRPLHLYWQGTSKQNLRTRTTQARVAGFNVRAIDSSEVIAVISQVYKDKGWAEHEIEANLRKMGLRRGGESLAGTICVGVFDPSEHVVGFCLGTQTGEVVRTLLAFNSHRGTVRWLCFSGYVEQVSAMGGRFIIESPPWAFTGGNKIFAGHLGFVPARIRSG